mmetsp:Transcript_18930/g.48193  ORF Transcript_18930/g.48193 Transcript_18930/m.48193 type:complete len:108 (+) Transcript_18930:2497-2820(+)
MTERCSYFTEARTHTFSKLQCLTTTHAEMDGMVTVSHLDGIVFYHTSARLGSSIERQIQTAVKKGETERQPNHAAPDKHHSCVILIYMPRLHPTLSSTHSCPFFCFH